MSFDACALCSSRLSSNRCLQITLSCPSIVSSCRHTALRPHQGTLHLRDTTTKKQSNAAKHNHKYSSESFNCARSARLNREMYIHSLFFAFNSVHTLDWSFYDLASLPKWSHKKTNNNAARPANDSPLFVQRDDHHQRDSAKIPNDVWHLFQHLHIANGATTQGFEFSRNIYWRESCAAINWSRRSPFYRVWLWRREMSAMYNICVNAVATRWAYDLWLWHTEQHHRAVWVSSWLVGRVRCQRLPSNTIQYRRVPPINAFPRARFEEDNAKDDAYILVQSFASDQLAARFTRDTIYRYIPAVASADVGASS